MQLNSRGKNEIARMKKTFYDGLIISNDNARAPIGHILFIWTPLSMSFLLIYLSIELQKPFILIFALLNIILGIVMFILTLKANLDYYFCDEKKIEEEKDWCTKTLESIELVKVTEETPSWLVKSQNNQD